MAMSRREMMKAIAAGAYCQNSWAAPNNAWAQAGSARRSLALTVGLNAVDPRFYGGWSGVLQGCEADARAYTNIAKPRFDQVIELLTNRATISQVARHILWAAKELKEGDVFFVAYAGHGGQMADNRVKRATTRTKRGACTMVNSAMTKFTVFGSTSGKASEFSSCRTAVTAEPWHVSRN